MPNRIQSPDVAQVARQHVADPSPLTTAALLREISMLEKNFSVRFDAMDDAIRLTNTYPTLLDKTKAELLTLIDQSVKALRELHEEKFRRLDTMFAERDDRTERTQRDMKVAVDAAFAAAKEAVAEQNKSNALSIAKSEAAFTKQIDTIGDLVKAYAKTTDDKIGDMKERVTAIEGQKQGAKDNTSLIVSMISALFAVVSIAGMVVAFMTR